MASIRLYSFGGNQKNLAVHNNHVQRADVTIFIFIS